MPRHRVNGDHGPIRRTVLPDEVCAVTMGSPKYSTTDAALAVAESEADTRSVAWLPADRITDVARVRSIDASQRLPAERSMSNRSTRPDATRVDPLDSPTDNCALFL